MACAPWPVLACPRPPCCACLLLEIGVEVLENVLELPRVHAHRLALAAVVLRTPHEQLGRCAARVRDLEVGVPRRVVLDEFGDVGEALQFSLAHAKRGARKLLGGEGALLRATIEAVRCDRCGNARCVSTTGVRMAAARADGRQEARRRVEGLSTDLGVVEDSPQKHANASESTISRIRHRPPALRVVCARARAFAILLTFVVDEAGEQRAIRAQLQPCEPSIRARGPCQRRDGRLGHSEGVRRANDARDDRDHARHGLGAPPDVVRSRHRAERALLPRRGWMLPRAGGAGGGEGPFPKPRGGELGGGGLYIYSGLSSLCHIVFHIVPHV